MRRLDQLETFFLEKKLLKKLNHQGFLLLSVLPSLFPFTAALEFFNENGKQKEEVVNGPYISNTHIYCFTVSSIFRFLVFV